MTASASRSRSSSWTLDVHSLAQDVLAGASLLVVGGPLTGMSSACATLNETLEKGTTVYLRTAKVSTLVAESPTAGAFIQNLLSVPRLVVRPTELDPIAWSESIRDSLRELDRRALVITLDGAEALVDAPWSVEVADWLRSLLGSGQHIRLVVFAKPQAIPYLGGASSPLVGLLKCVTVQPSRGDLVRADVVSDAISNASAMRGVQLAGGQPWAVLHAAELCELGLSDEEILERLRAAHEDKIERQVSVLSDRALQICEILGSDGALTVGALRARLDGSSIDSELRELEAGIICSSQHGVLSLHSRLHAPALRRSVAARPAQRTGLSERDVEAYREISRLEWRLRAVLENRLRACFGEAWLESIPSAVLHRARERHEIERNGEAVTASPTVLDYIDFGDVREVLRERTVWRIAFSIAIGEWREELFGALERLESLRRKVAHSRPLTPAEADRVSTDSRIVGTIVERLR